MKQQYFKKLAFMLAAVAVTAASCQKEPVPGDPSVIPGLTKVAPDGFNYSTSKTVKVEIRLLTNTNQPISGVPVTFFDPKAAALNQSLFKAVSDNNGNVTGTLTIPGYLDTLLVRTNYIGLPVDVRVLVVNNALTATIGGSSGISGNVVAASGMDDETILKSTLMAPKTMASSIDFGWPRTGKYPDMFVTNKDYPQSVGRPSWIEGTIPIPQSLLDDANASLPEGHDVSAVHPDYMASQAVTTVNMLKNSDVYVSFIHEGAGFKNTIAYYIYDTGTPPSSVDAISNATYLFPNVSMDAGNKALNTGDIVRIRDVPAGKSIGFILLQNSWKANKGPYDSKPKDNYSNLWGVDTDVQKFFSNTALNPESSASKKKHTVMVYDNIYKVFLMGFEDLNRQDPSTNGATAADNDFNDVVILISSVAEDGISTNGVPAIARAGDKDGDTVQDMFDEYPEDPARAYNNYYPSRDTDATLAFEDNWPATGDYDLNDMVMKYRYTYVTNANNQVVELTGRYEVAASGAGNKNGFGVELPFNSSLVSSVTGQRITGSYIQLAANGTEAGQTKAVIIPFDNQDNVIKNTDGTPFVNTLMDKGKVSSEVINVKVTFTSPISVETLGAAPYNPFLISSGRRGYEIHLPGFLPTIKADKSLFGTQADNSSEAANRYYLSGDNRPWALNFTEQFQYPVEYQNIDQVYLHYLDWARSGGTNFTDWYKRTGADYRNTTYIYTK